MALEELVKLLLGIAVFIFVVSFLISLYLVVTAKEKSTIENDFYRVKQDIEAVTIETGTITTPIFSDNIELRLLKLGSKAEGGCKKESICLCYKKATDKETSYKCESLNKDAKKYDVASNPRDVAPSKTLSIAIHNTADIFIG